MIISLNALKYHLGVDKYYHQGDDMAYAVNTHPPAQQHILVGFIHGSSAHRSHVCDVGIDVNMKSPHQQRVDQELKYPRQSAGGTVITLEDVRANREATRDPHIRDSSTNPVSDQEWDSIKRRNTEARAVRRERTRC